MRSQISKKQKCDHHKCRNSECQHCTLMLNYTYRGRLPEVKQQISEMAINGSGIHDTARVLKISTLTVIGELKKPRFAWLFD